MTNTDLDEVVEESEPEQRPVRVLCENCGYAGRLFSHCLCGQAYFPEVEGRALRKLLAVGVFIMASLVVPLGLRYCYGPLRLDLPVGVWIVLSIACFFGLIFYVARIYSVRTESILARLGNLGEGAPPAAQLKDRFEIAYNSAILSRLKVGSMLVAAVGFCLNTGLPWLNWGMTVGGLVVLGLSYLLIQERLVLNREGQSITFHRRLLGVESVRCLWPLSRIESVGVSGLHLSHKIWGRDPEGEPPTSWNHAVVMLGRDGKSLTLTPWMSEGAYGVVVEWAGMLADKLGVNLFPPQPEGVLAAQSGRWQYQSAPARLPGRMMALHYLYGAAICLFILSQILRAMR